MLDDLLGPAVRRSSVPRPARTNVDDMELVTKMAAQLRKLEEAQRNYR